MENIEIKETASSPSITLDTTKGEYVFAGRSLPEDPIEFYEPVLEWFENYKASPLNGVNFEFKLTYFNTASSKVFFQIFHSIDQLNVNNPGIDNKIVMYANSDDEDLLELFDYYKELLTSNCLVLEAF